MDVNINVDSSVVIDLTEEDDEEEDEPMGQNNQKATISDEISTVEATMTTQVEEAVGGPGGESSAAAAAPAPVTEPRPQTKPTEPTSEAMPDLGEEVESDVDEAWPSVPSPVSSRAKRTKEEKGTTLEGARNTLQHSQNEQEDKRRVQDGTNDNEREGRISLEDSNEEMDVDVDVDEELPNQTPTPGKNTSTSPDLSSAYRIVELENLEDGEIYEEGAGTSSSCCSANEATQDIDTRGYEGHGFFVFIITIFSGLRSTQTFRAFQPRN
ncbi:hypothetical protein G195_001472 [Phytophthora kernoviae 00238/432]|uniref:Uncharacterized protein n=1 Tax=Phytophthora kernoviae 00238/432 TaxID=1284355 RepID=A0A8J4STT8_9STRA|nr:hypothetical protein G195_001472 [Phytophthora kernoviae 00238/432]